MSLSRMVACGNFVRRQTKESGYSHFDGTWEELESIVEYLLRYYPKQVRPGYKDGVCLVDINPNPDDGLSIINHVSRFYSAIVALDLRTKLTANYSPRRITEAPFIRVSAKAKKQPAKYASVVLYRHDVLAENNERETDAEWEIVCIKARVTEEEEPMDPYTMARNFLHLTGGTKGDFSAEDFAKSIVYWNSHTMCSGEPKWRRKIIKFFGSILKIFS